jgi:hypothetical protein
MEERRDLFASAWSSEGGLLPPTEELVEVGWPEQGRLGRQREQGKGLACHGAGEREDGVGRWVGGGREGGDKKDVWALVVEMKEKYGR